MGGILGDSCRKFTIAYQPEEWSQRIGQACKRCQKNLSYESSVSPCRCYLFCHEQCFKDSFVKQLHGVNTEVRCLACRAELQLRMRAQFTCDPSPTLARLCRLAVAWVLLLAVIFLIVATLNSSLESHYVFFVMYLEGFTLSLVLYWLVLCCRDLLFRQRIIILEVGSTKLDIQTSAFQDI